MNRLVFPIIALLPARTVALDADAPIHAS